jgi:hypothetical protein
VKNRRLINNLTGMSMMATLYVQANNDLNSIYGTLNITLQPSESMEVEYGDLRNGFLLGLRVKPVPTGVVEAYYFQVKQRGDVVDNWLNNADAIDITMEYLHNMDSHLPIEQSLRASKMV